MRSVVAAALLGVAAVPAATQRLEPFMPVGVVVSPADSLPNRQELQGLARRRFNVIAVRDAAGDLRVTRLTEWLDSAKPPLPIPSAGLALVSTAKSGRQLRLEAWHAMARGARGVLFDGVTSTQNDDGLAVASEFADNVTRNAALYAPLRPRESARDVRVVDAPASAIDARLLESNAALVLIAVNLTPDVHRVTLQFSTEFPEAIWQNMETGAAVNFVASAEGPTYTRTFTAFDVLVLMIRKQYK